MQASETYRVDFLRLPWEVMMPGVRHKHIDRDGVRLRIEGRIGRPGRLDKNGPATHFSLPSEILLVCSLPICLPIFQFVRGRRTARTVLI